MAKKKCTKKKCCKKPEPDFLYATDITTFACHDNEIYLTLEYYENSLSLDEPVKKEKTIIMDAYTFLNSGLCEKEYIKKQVIKHIEEL